MTNNKLRCFSILFMLAATAVAAAPIDVGSRLEPIVDDYLIERLDGTTLRMHSPTPREIVLKLDRPYFTVLKDGDRYRMYYRANHTLNTTVTCYAESDDGINWTKPDLGLFEVQGTKQNNVILARHPACINFTPFLDANPDAPADQRYKALGGQSSYDDPNDCGLYAFVSPDGVHWRQLRDKMVVTRDNKKRHAFDSQNVSFWSKSEGCYVCYFRIWEDNIRWIARTTSKDFVNWTPSVVLTLDGKPRQQLYTSQLAPYVRAPHIYIGLPTRFMRNRAALGADQMEALGTPKAYLKDCTDITLISTRGGLTLKRTFLEAFIRPGLDPHNWTSRANYAACGILQTGEAELSLYVLHNNGYPSAYIRRYTLRPDGFASVNAPFAGGEMTTKPIRFSGNRLSINYSTSAAGGLRVEIQDAEGRPIPGFTLDDCPEIIGDHIERIVSWKNGSDVGRLAGKTIRLRFLLKDADLYAFRFSEK